MTGWRTTVREVWLRHWPRLRAVALRLAQTAMAFALVVAATVVVLTGLWSRDDVQPTMRGVSTYLWHALFEPDGCLSSGSFGGIVIVGEHRSAFEQRVGETAFIDEKYSVDRTFSSFDNKRDYENKASCNYIRANYGYDGSIINRHLVYKINIYNNSIFISNFTDKDGNIIFATWSAYILKIDF